MCRKYWASQRAKPPSSTSIIQSGQLPARFGGCGLRNTSLAAWSGSAPFEIICRKRMQSRVLNAKLMTFIGPLEQHGRGGIYERWPGIFFYLPFPHGRVAMQILLPYRIRGECVSVDVAALKLSQDFQEFSLIEPFKLRRRF